MRQRSSLGGIRLVGVLLFRGVLFNWRAAGAETTEVLSAGPTIRA